ncbi:unnamed protein product [Microthlaspi erraticum]|uniref:Zinc knuckle CX2CX4HX4C domain-containing protein n=1 Tax=Microthlaspi erraticum TaxID=1685480 RepID=A0A6D2J5S4_9BRAS|nr:unnamed protein product [Microthlaspi erraticum]
MGSNPFTLRPRWRLKEDVKFSFSYGMSVYLVFAKCFSLCHDVDQCPLLYAHRVERDRTRRREEKTEARALSYKGAVQSSTGNMGRNNQEERKVDYKGKGKMVDRDEASHKQYENRGRSRPEVPYGEGSSHHRGGPTYRPKKEMQKRYDGAVRGPKCSLEEQDVAHEAKMKAGDKAKSQDAGQSRTICPTVHSAKKVRRSLAFEEEETESSTMMITETVEVPVELAALPSVHTNEGGEGSEREVDGSQGFSDTGEVSPGGAEDMTPSDEELLLEDLLVEEGELGEEEEENGGQREDSQVMLPEEENDVVLDDIMQDVQGGQNLCEEPRVPQGGQGGTKGRPGERKVGAKKKVFRTNVGIGGGALRRLAQVAKMPRKKGSGRIGMGDKIEPKPGKDGHEGQGGGKSNAE